MLNDLLSRLRFFVRFAEVAFVVQCCSPLSAGLFRLGFCFTTLPARGIGVKLRRTYIRLSLSVALPTHNIHQAFIYHPRRSLTTKRSLYWPTRKSTREKKTPPDGGVLSFEVSSRLHAVVHVELHRVGGHAHASDVFHLQVDVSIDEVIGEHTARGEEGAICI
jgi:hypothetical protein